MDAFVTKINPSGSGLVYSTYLGGSAQDNANAIAVDSAGNVYITGLTQSTDFPTTPGAYQTTNKGGYGDAFVTKIDSSGAALGYSTYLGGSSQDEALGIAVDSSRNAYITGYAQSTDFPTTPGVYQTTSKGAWDVFVAKIGGRLMTVAKSGTGTGTVTSSLFGINCGPGCTNAQSSFGDGNIVTLTAAPAAGSYFAGWSGDCVSQALTCRVTMDATKNVTATFNPGPPPTTTWAKIYGNNQYVATGIQQTSDGGYVVGGYTLAGVGENDVWVLRLNSDGTIVWQKAYGGLNEDNSNFIQQTSDGGYIIGGRTQSFGPSGQNMWILKLNWDGTIGWQKTYDTAGIESARSVQETSDGGYVIAGSTGGTNSHVWILKLDVNGNASWQNTYGGPNIDNGIHIQQTSDGGYILGGSTYSFGVGSSDIWVLKLHSDGTIAWQKTYGGSLLDTLAYVQETSDGGFIVAGNTYSFGAGGSDIWIFKLDNVGTVRWQKTYGGSSEDYAFSIQQTSDGGYIVAGETCSFGANLGSYSDIWVLKLNSNGTIAWEKTYGSVDTYESSAWGPGISETSDGGYILAGHTGSFGGGVFILKLDSTGHISGCPSGLVWDSSAVVSDTSIIGNNTTVAPVAVSINVTSSDATVTTTDVTDDLVCTGIPCTYSILPTSDSYPAGGGGGFVSVIAPAGCNWTAASNDSWIIRTSGASGSGNGTVDYLVTINSGSPEPVR